MVCLDIQGHPPSKILGPPIPHAFFRHLFPQEVWLDVYWGYRFVVWYVSSPSPVSEKNTKRTFISACFGYLQRHQVCRLEDYKGVGMISDYFTLVVQGVLTTQVIYPDTQCMVYLPTFSIHINLMWVKMPYIDPIWDRDYNIF